MSAERPDGWSYWYRVVDAENQGWHPTAKETPDEPAFYRADYGFQREGLGDVRILDELEAERGPLRRVMPITGEDGQLLRHALAAAGRKAVYTVAVAVQRAFNELRERHGGLPALTDSYQGARTHLLAGREDSSESEALMDLVLWADRRKVKRIYEPSRQAITEMIVRWTTDPERFTEVAETLAHVVSSYADEQGGWGAVADQWLQPGALDTEGVHVTYKLLYSRSDEFDPAVLG